jgi:glycosyltransferase involved in cell wall biosynthesis
MRSSARALILDITRLVARAGGAPLTGIDRVERAYLAKLAAGDAPCLMLCKTALGFMIFGPEVAAKILAWIDDPSSLPPAPVIGRMLARRRQNPDLEAALRPLALVRLRPGALGGWLAKALPGGGLYLNVGHVNLSDQTLAELRGVAGMTTAVMIHDTIALDFPEYSADRAPTEFRKKLKAALTHGDVILCPSGAVAADIARWAARFDAVVPRLVAPLGVDLATPDNVIAPAPPPYFVALGTIEPRKDHGLLLDVWADFHARLPPEDIPRLFIIGRRGWKNDAVFARLDSEAFMGQTVFELAGLSDGAVAALVQGACALLAPSRAEGFGLAPAEAAGRGVRVVATDLAVTREILGDYPIYLGPGDRYAWADTITRVTRQAASPKSVAGPADIPDWTAHFNLVFSKL